MYFISTEKIFLRNTSKKEWSRLSVITENFQQGQSSDYLALVVPSKPLLLMQKSLAL